MSLISRRALLKGIGLGVGAAIGARLPGARLLGTARADGAKPTAVVLLHLVGGYNAIFTSANTLVGSFGVTAGNHSVLAGGVGVDDTFAGLSAFAKGHMAAVGVRHSLSSHDAARRALWTHDGKNAGLVLAKAIGGDGPIKAAWVGGAPVKDAPIAPADGVAFEEIRDLARTIDVLGGGAGGARVPDRDLALAGLRGSHAMSGGALTGSPESLVTLGSGFTAALETLARPPAAYDLTELQQAYALDGASAIRSFASKLAGAELMIRAGTNVVGLLDTGWDTHGDGDGSVARTKMKALVPALDTFITRMVADTTRNVTLVIMGDFARSLPGSNHQPNLTATVIGPSVKPGTTGRTDADVNLKTDTPGATGLWTYLAALAKVGASPFGANQHPSLVA